MFRPHLIRAFVFAALVAPVSVSAQAGPVRAPAGCTYETCALRIEQGFFSAPVLLRGRAGEQVGSLGPFGGGVDTLLAGPDSAAAYARRYVTNTRRATTLGLIGTAAFIVALARTDNFRNGDDVATAFAITALGFSLASIPFELRARRSLSRSVWFYNSVLPTR
jgi:hypothetical protein